MNYDTHQALDMTLMQLVGWVIGLVGILIVGYVFMIGWCVL